MSSPKNIIIRKDNIKRLIKDVRGIINEPLHDNGIYYHHDDENILKGYCLICGPADTPYFGGYYFFELSYPSDYPHSPPVVTYHTNSEKIRFNPNLYTNGKVCVSLLNTWRGEQWTSCQTISTVLLTICSLLNDAPLLNEPGISEKHHDFKSYNKIIAFKNIDIAVIKILTKSKDIHLPYFDYFESHVLDNLKKNYMIINKHLDDMSKTDTEHIHTGLYNMNVVINYKELHKKYNKVLKQFKLKLN